jgi:hypothetical protein
LIERYSPVEFVCGVFDMFGVVNVGVVDIGVNGGGD